MAAKIKRGRRFIYTLEHDAALRKGVKDYGLDFERIKDENKDLFDSRTAKSLYNHFKCVEPDKFQELRAATPRHNAYTPVQDAALKKGVDDYGLDFERIKDENKDLFYGRTAGSLYQRFYKLERRKYQDLKAATQKIPRPNRDPQTTSTSTSTSSKTSTIANVSKQPQKVSPPPPRPKVSTTPITPPVNQNALDTLDALLKSTQKRVEELSSKNASLKRKKGALKELNSTLKEEDL